MPVAPPAVFFKSGTRKNEWRCMMCCHVKTGTIFLGLWHLMLQLLAISTLGVFLQHPNLLKPFQITKTSLVENNELPTALAERNIPILNVDSVSTEGSVFSNYDQSMIEPGTGGSAKNGEYFATYGMFIGRPLRYEELNVVFFIIFCTLIITSFMLYGAIKEKPKMLIPFFCMQLFDLFLTILSALGYLCYLPDFHRLMVRTESAYAPSVHSINPQYISFIVVFSLMVSIISKGYFVAVVWSCYKYLTLKKASAQPTIHYIESNFVVQNLLHPDNDINIKKFPAPPPSYAVAVGEVAAHHPNVPPPSYNSN